MINDKARQFIEGLFSEVWTVSNTEKMSEYYHQDVRAYVGDKVLDYQALYTQIMHNKENIQNYQVDILDLFSSGNKISARMKQTALNKQASSPLSFHVIVIYHLQDSKIISLWAELTGNLAIQESVE